MLKIDLEQFVLAGKIPPLDHRTTRQDLLSLLGPNESTYPDIFGYGHIGFDFGDTPFLHGVSILFPNFFLRCQDELRERWKHHWPDSRLDWNLGRIKPDMTDEIARDFLQLTDSQWRDYLSNTTGSCRMMLVPDSPAMIQFAPKGQTGAFVVESIFTYIRSGKK